MTRDEILDEWTKDGIIDPAHLDTESLNIPRLHAKYIRFLSNEKMTLRAYEAELKKLSLEKYEWLLHGDTVESKKLGWELPPSGRIMRVEVDRYLSADEDINKLTFKLENQRQKVYILEDILKVIHGRNFLIKNAISFQIFQNGG
jgi:hypothetical protein